MVAVEQFPGGDRARHGHGVRCEAVDLSDPLVGVPCRIGRRRRPPGPVEGDRPRRAGRQVQRETIAADTGHRRFHHAQGGDRGERGVDGVAARFQHRQANLGGQRVGGRDNGVFGVDRRAARTLEGAHGRRGLSIQGLKSAIYPGSSQKRSVFSVPPGRAQPILRYCLSARSIGQTLLLNGS